MDQALKTLLSPQTTPNSPDEWKTLFHKVFNSRKQQLKENTNYLRSLFLTCLQLETRTEKIPSKKSLNDYENAQIYQIRSVIGQKKAKTISHLKKLINLVVGLNNATNEVITMVVGVEHDSDYGWLAQYKDCYQEHLYVQILQYLPTQLLNLCGIQLLHTDDEGIVANSNL